MSNLAVVPEFADQEDASRYFIARQESDDYLGKRISQNVLSALDQSSRFHEASDGLWGRYRNITTESASSVSRTADEIDVDHIVPPIHDQVVRTQNLKAKPTLTPTAEWEGYIESIDGEEFFVVMTNVRSNCSLPTDQAMFSISDINEYERPLLKEGAIVRWIIGRERLPTGQIRKVSELYFRRLPAHTEAGYLRAYHKAKSLLEEVVWNEGA